MTDAGRAKHIPMSVVGLPTLGGRTATQGGPAFFAGTQDCYLRALDTGTKNQLWKARLPVGERVTLWPAFRREPAGDVS